MSSPDDRGLSYCAREVRQHDHDRFLTGLFAPAARREALYALYAFNLEVARTAELVSEPMLGRIRLQWWREAIDEIYAGTPRRHHVVEPLADAVQRHGLSRALFDQLIDGRERDLEDAPPVDLPALEVYAAATSASLVRLAVESLADDPERRDAAAPAAEHVGIAWALTGLIRAVPFHARQKRLYLPVALTAAAGLDVGALFELKTAPALCQVVRWVAERAEEQLGLARAQQSRVGRKLLPALLPAVLARQHLAVLRRAGYDPLKPEVQAQSGMRVWRLAAAALRGRF